MSIDEFLQNQLGRGDCAGLSHADWEIPDYWRRLDYVDEFNEASFSTLAKRLAEWDPTSKWIQTRNSTANPGYRHYCRQGQISPQTQQLLRESVFQKRYEAIRDHVASIR